MGGKGMRDLNNIAVHLELDNFIVGSDIRAHV